MTPTPPIFCGGCDYLGLSIHPEVIQAAIDHAVQGLSAGASRTTTGDRPIYRELEADLASLTGYGAAALAVNGMLANIAACQTLASQGIRHAVIDERAHTSLADAARAAGMSTHFYDHRNAHAARQAMSSIDSPCVILTDSVFTATGEIAPLRELLATLGPDDRLLIDECHAFTTIGASGSGSAAHLGLDTSSIIATTTLAKGLGCAGGAVLGNESFIDQVRSSATAYIGTTPPPPPIAEAARKALEIMRTSTHLHTRLRDNAERAASILREAGMESSSHETPIFAFSVDDRSMPALRDHLLNNGVDVPLMSYPGGPTPRYFRLTVTALHIASDLDRLADAITTYRE